MRQIKLFKKLKKVKVIREDMRKFNKPKTCNIQNNKFINQSPNIKKNPSKDNN